MQRRGEDSGAAIELRQNNYSNNIVEQDHRATKRRVRPMLGFKSFGSAAKLFAGIETMHVISKRQLACPEGSGMSAADQFYSLAFEPAVSQLRSLVMHSLLRQNRISS